MKFHIAKKLAPANVDHVFDVLCGCTPPPGTTLMRDDLSIDHPLVCKTCRRILQAALAAEPSQDLKIFKKKLRAEILRRTCFEDAGTCYRPPAYAELGEEDEWCAMCSHLIALGQAVGVDVTKAEDP